MPQTVHFKIILYEITRSNKIILLDIARMICHLTVNMTHVNLKIPILKHRRKINICPNLEFLTKKGFNREAFVSKIESNFWFVSYKLMVNRKH